MDSERLARYVAGEAGTAERAEVEQWAAASPTNASELARLKTAWTAPAAPEAWDVDRAWARVAARLDTARPAADLVPIARRRAVRWLAAAAVLLAAGLGYWALAGGGPQQFVTGPGEQRLITLADGSLVTLAPASRLVVDAGYGRPGRTMTLEGRAFFVVTHDAARPFRVTTPGAVIEDLGTEFEVDTWGPMVKVGVAVGAVAIHRPGAPVLNLSAGDLASVAREGEILVAHATPIERMKSWTAGQLQFDDRPLAEVALELERWYGIEVSVDGEARAKPFTGPLPVDSLGRAVETLATAFPELQFARTDRTISIRPKAPR